MSLRTRQAVTAATLLLAAVLVAFTVDTWTAGPLLGALLLAALVAFPVLETIEERRQR